jgi:regulator of PEP synthase PpsR (kinase-PPPase family)
MSEDEGKVQEIFVVSDGTAETAHAVTRAIMFQFALPWHLRTFSGIGFPSEIRRVVDEAEAAGAFIAFTLVDGDAKDELERYCAERSIQAIDLLGRLLDKFSAQLDARPRMVPGVLHTITDDYFKRIDAVEFTVRHDDGASLHTLHHADLVLVGVSRTSKTPLSMYLAQRGYKTGNVPIVPNIPVPKEVLELPREKVFGLNLSASLLLKIREARLRNMGSSTRASYADPGLIKEELDQAKRLYRQHHWPVIEISGKAVEENAARIIELLESREAHLEA